jgi:tetratricopeptide (TPR) repeat protein
VSIRKLIWLVAAVGPVAVACAQGQTDHYLGADAILKQLPDSGQDQLRRFSSIRKGSPIPDPLEDARKAYIKEAASLEPKVSAKRWLGLVHDYFVQAARQSQSPGSHTTSVSFGGVIAALPPPEQWAALNDQIKADCGHNPDAKQSLLLLLGDALTGNLETQWSDTKALQSAMDAHRYAQTIFNTKMPARPWRIQEVLERRIGDADRTEEYFLSLVHRSPAGGAIGIPDLVPLMGAERATAFIRRLVDNSPFSLVFDGKSVQIAADVELKDIKQIRIPQWSLACSLDQFRLYEALRARFPTWKETYSNALMWQDYNITREPFAEATSFYLTHLLLSGQGSDCLKILQKDTGIDVRPPEPLARIFLENPILKAFGETLFTEAEKEPNGAKALHLLELSRSFGSSHPRGPLLEKILSHQPDTTTRAQALDMLFTTYCYHGEFDHALKIAEAIPQYLKPNDYNTFDLVRKLIELATVLHRPDILDVALKVYAPSDLGSENGLPLNLIDALIASGKGPEAERFALRMLTLEKSPADIFTSMGSRQGLAGLVHIYTAAGRFKDAMTLINKAPALHGQDASTFAAGFGFDTSLTPLAYDLYRCLKATGYQGNLDQLLLSILVYHPRFDPGYQALLEQKGEAAFSVLERLRKNDPTSAKALQWEAQFLLNQGRISQAEAKINDAIEKEPYDLLLESGSRAGPYRLRAQIYEEEGKAGQADADRRVADAIVLAEDGAEALDCNARSQAKDKFQEALKKNPKDFYARIYLGATLTDIPEARNYTRSGLELLPPMVGNGGFPVGADQLIYVQPLPLAEDAFRAYVRDHPNDPKGHLVLAKTLESEKQLDEAKAEYLLAEQGEPPLLDAVNAIADRLPSTVPISNAERNWAYLTILRSTRQWSGGGYEVNVTDYASLYRVLAASPHNNIEIPSPVYSMGTVTERPLFPSKEEAGLEEFASDTLMAAIARYMNLFVTGNGFGDE